MTDEPPPVPAPPPDLEWRARDGWACFLAYLGATLLCTFAAGVLLGVVAAVQGRDAKDLAEASTPFIVVMVSVAAGLAAWGVARLRLGGPVFARGRRPLGLFPVGKRAVGRATLQAGGIALGLLFVLPRLVPPPAEPPPESLAHMASSGTPGLVAFMIVALFLAPPIEEFVFRGALYGGLARKHRPTTAAVIVTLLFTVLHVPEAIAWWPALIAIALMGVVTVRFRMVTGSILPGLAAHVCYNALITMPLFQ